MPRLPTGLKRPYPFQLQLNHDEMEFSQRLAFAFDKSRAELFRLRFFHPGWQKLLIQYRKEQKKIPSAKIFGKNH